MVTLAAGVGSRWTTGAGVVKAVNPFVTMAGRHRSFLEIHLAKTRADSQKAPAPSIPHVVTTSYLTHAAIERHLARTSNYGHDGPVYLSRGQSIGQRLIPMARDLTFLWEEATHEPLDENKQKVREAGRRAILEWATEPGRRVRLHRQPADPAVQPAGPLLRGAQPAAQRSAGPAARRLSRSQVADGPQHRHPGRDPRPGHARPGHARATATLSFEVIPRRIDDRGGGLARVAGRLRLLEGLAQPREETEFALRYYNTLTTWVRIDGLLAGAAT